MRAAPNGFTGAGSSAPSPGFSGVGEFPTRLPIQVSDRIGVDQPAIRGPCAYNCISLVSGGTREGWTPTLGDGEAGRAPSTSSAATALINADVEPDADGDTFGDETQDKCVGSFGTQDGCTLPSGLSPPAPATTVATPSGPRANLSGSKSQNVLGRGEVTVFVVSAEAGTAAATGTINVTGASKVYTLKPASSNLAPGAETRLRLKLSSKTKRAVRKGLRKGKKLNARVTATIKNTAGGSAIAKRTVKIKGIKPRRR